jgi:deoxyribodipyrimidine photo-lyase
VSLAPAPRVRALNAAPVAGAGRYVLHWMTAFRRTRWNFALEHALARARELGKPLVVLEALRSDHEHATERIQRFVIDGMADQRERFARAGIAYHPYVEPRRGAGRGLLAALARDAALVVADDWPGYFLPRMLAAAARKTAVRLEAVDACGILPLAATPGPFPTAYAFRRFLQRELPAHLATRPAADPLARVRAKPAALPRAVLARWPAADDRLLGARGAGLAGGEAAGRRRLARFLSARLPRYGERNDPAVEATSGLSPYLHFGHVSSHEALARILDDEDWTPERLGRGAAGKREGWWGLSAAAEGFLDQLVTWRELGFAAARHESDLMSLAALPAWAQKTLGEHAGDARRPRYELEDFEAARTHDPLWNAAQRQLLAEGTIHNYLRMLWGKKVLEWSASPAEALAILYHLNDRHALDGRDPNSASGILWTLGRYDRPWGPERPVFGTVRYMSSAATARKLDVEPYLRRFGP